MSLELNGTTGVNLVQDGVITDANLPAGSVLQVVQTQSTTQETFTSGAYTSTSSFSGVITPSSTSNKIFVVADVAMMYYLSSGNSAHALFRLYRAVGATASAASTGQTYDYGGSGILTSINLPINWLDSPSTTSQLTYVLQVSKQAGEQARLNYNGGTSRMTLLEIAG
tara:strand:- start:211 stop:714 length:504 start_codon:yes stop_codon:yes gene_type:complete